MPMSSRHPLAPCGALAAKARLSVGGPGESCSISQLGKQAQLCEAARPLPCAFPQSLLGSGTQLLTTPTNHVLQPLCFKSSIAKQSEETGRGPRMGMGRAIQIGPSYWAVEDSGPLTGRDGVDGGPPAHTEASGCLHPSPPAWACYQWLQLHRWKQSQGPPHVCV